MVAPRQPFRYMREFCILRIKRRDLLNQPPAITLADIEALSVSEWSHEGPASKPIGGGDTVNRFHLRRQQLTIAFKDQNLFGQKASLHFHKGVKRFGKVSKGVSDPQGRHIRSKQ